MALSCAPSDLVSAASCFTCEIEGQLNPINTYLLAQILLALDPMADVSPQTLITSAGCLQCLTPGQLSFINTYLLCQIASAGGGLAGTDYILEYANQAALPAAPADTTKVWMARFRDGSAGKTWSVVNQAWF